MVEGRRVSILAHLAHFSDHGVKGRGGRLVFVDGRVKQVLARGLELVLVALGGKESSGGAEVGNASRDGNASSGHDDNLFLLAQGTEQPLHVEIVLVAEVVV